MTTDLEVAVGAMLVAREALLSTFTRSLVTQIVTCQNGCSHCCHWPMAISLLEGAEICLQLKRDGRWTRSLQESLKAGADLVTGLSFTVWAYSGIPCVFLDKGHCSIYDSRPASCRLAVSLGDPDTCKGHNLVRARHIVPSLAELTAFHETERLILKRYNANLATMPIPTAVLVAHRILSGEFLLSQASDVTFAEHVGRI